MLKRLKDIYRSFAVQLLILHVKNNVVLLFLWIFPVLVLRGGIGSTYGMKYLYVNPEYLGEINFWSFMWVGICFGGFLMSWNVTTYILNSYRFPFLASLNRPFTKYSINNSLIPLAFVLFYLGMVINFQWYNELAAENSIVFDLLGFFAGVAIALLLAALYFQLTNNDVGVLRKQFIKNKKKLPRILRNKKDIANDPEGIFRNAIDVDYYLTGKLKIRPVRDVEHYPIEWLHKVFRQNHQNALVVQLLSIVILFMLGMFVENPWLRIPAGASLFIFSAILTSLVGALTYWMGAWRTTTFVLLFLAINSFSGLSPEFENHAYGLNYKTEKARYRLASLDSLCNPTMIQNDLDTTLQILKKWRKKFGRGRLIRKPRLVIIATSGGGLRQAVWTVHALQKADSLLKGKLLDHTILMTGASGGMIGAAYMRELYLQEQFNDSINLYDPIYVHKIAEDLLNPIIFTALANDMFVPWLQFQDGDYSYYKDRGYIFEQQLLENTDGALNKRLKDYRQPERDAIIPMMFFTPVSATDLRQIYISPQGVSYMTHPVLSRTNDLIVETDAIDFGQLFANQDAYNLQLTSALRMNATFPYILPNAYLPSEPAIQVIDAGWRDNFGVAAASRFVLNFSDWIKQNTSGVLILQLRGEDKTDEIFTPRGGTTILERLLNPLGTAAQTSTIQDYHNDTYVNAMIQALGKNKVDIVHLVYRPTKNNQRASMTWHLTAREKIDVQNALYDKENQESLMRLEELVK